MAGVTSPRLALGDVVIVGGGCYGRFYAGQLLRARERGAANWRRLLVVDRDPSCQVARELGLWSGVDLVVEEWSAFFDRYFASAPAQSDPPDTIVPSPLMPHLMYEWLVRRAHARWPDRLRDRRLVALGPGTRYERAARDGSGHGAQRD